MLSPKIERAFMDFCQNELKGQEDYRESSSLLIIAYRLYNLHRAFGDSLETFEEQTAHLDSEQTRKVQNLFKFLVKG